MDHLKAEAPKGGRRRGALNAGSMLRGREENAVAQQGRQQTEELLRADDAVKPGS